MLNKEFLDSILNYDPGTGVFIWKHRIDMPNNWNARFAGKPAGTIFNGRYILICIRYEKFLAHTIAWFLVHGEWVKGIDHKDRNGFNNAISNLRIANKSQNSANFRSKPLGIERHGAKFRARIKHYGKKIELGSFSTLEEAREAYALGHKRLFGEFSGFN